MDAVVGHPESDARDDDARDVCPMSLVVHEESSLPLDGTRHVGARDKFTVEPPMRRVIAPERDPIEAA